jgi:hypothetical protein
VDGAVALTASTNRRGEHTVKTRLGAESPSAQYDLVFANEVPRLLYFQGYPRTLLSANRAAALTSA